MHEKPRDCTWDVQTLSQRAHPACYLPSPTEASFQKCLQRGISSFGLHVKKKKFTVVIEGSGAACVQTVGAQCARVRRLISQLTVVSLTTFFFFFKASHTMNTARPVTENSDFFVSFVCVSLLLGRTCGPKTRVSKEH